VEIDVGGGGPCAFSGLRRLVQGVDAPAAVERAAAHHPIEWAELFPGGPGASGTIWDVANSPSERRLHRESEQVFRVLQAASDALVEAIAGCGRPVVLRRCGASDLVSLRGVMRAVERSRAAGVGGLMVCGEWEAAAVSGAMGERKQGLLDRLQVRMGATLEGESGPERAAALGGAGGVGAEWRHLGTVLDGERAPAERLAGALLAVRSCFFSTNYEGSLLACERGLGLLGQCPGVGAGEVAEAFAALDDGVGTPAIEIDAGSLPGSRGDLEALLWRSVGVDLALMGDPGGAMEAFQRGLGAGATALAEATLRMYVGLLLSKRMGRMDDAVAELERGLALVEADSSPAAAIAEGWLRNVIALVHFRRRHLRDAYTEEMRALRKVADQHDPSSTHLKINVISNLSVLQEEAGRRADALKIWRRFAEIGSDWGPNFIKHYAYREGRLNLGAGDEAAAMACYRRAFDSAVATSDAFHRSAIATELGGYHLTAGRLADAEHWYGEAVDRARDMGDPYRLGQGMAGLALARSETDLEPAAAMLAQSSSHVELARALMGAIASGDAAAVAAELPRPGGKLNRPFDLVNL